MTPDLSIVNLGGGGRFADSYSPSVAQGVSPVASPVQAVLELPSLSRISHKSQMGNRPQTSWEYWGISQLPKVLGKVGSNSVRILFALRKDFMFFAMGAVVIFPLSRKRSDT